MSSGKKKCNDNRKIPIWAQVKMVGEDIRFITPKDIWRSG